jgi:leucyl-tRNA synthetase
MAEVEAIVQNQDNREHDLLDSDDYYQFEGGAAAAVALVQGRDRPVYHNDHSRPERPVIRTLEDEIARVMRARVVNPKWIEGLRRHGYKGAFEIAATVDYLFAFAATTGAVRPHHFDLVEEAVLGDAATRDFIAAVGPDLATAGVGRPAVNYKLRDWLFSRQRFWGEPFPILHELDAQGTPTGVIRAVDPSELPVSLPHLTDFKPGDTPDPPLSRSPDDWLFVERDGRRYRRETNTMPQWAGSCWYYLRFLDPHNTERFVDPEIERAWMPVDLYIGGAEHAVLHLLYSRFWHKVLYDRGHVSRPEPFGKLVNQGMILGEMEFTGYRSAKGGWVSAEQRGPDDVAAKVPADQVEKQGEHFVLRDAPKIRVESRAYKMSKARGNVVNPDSVVRDFGADSLRLYEMFMGPLEATKPWSTTGVSGVRGFLDRCWRLVVDERADAVTLASQICDDPPSDEQLRELHRTVDKVTRDIEALSFNTAIARMMEFVNVCTPLERRPRAILEPFVTILAPFAPHLAEELWEILGRQAPVSLAPWPVAEERWLRDETVEIPVQIQGKLRGRVVVPADADADAMQAAALADPKIADQLVGREIVKVVAVPGRMVNFVVKG